MNVGLILICMLDPIVKNYYAILSPTMSDVSNCFIIGVEQMTME